MTRLATENVIRVLYREAAQHVRYSAEWYAVQPRIAMLTQMWRIDHTLQVVK